jgi:hypothetical protein
MSVPGNWKVMSYRPNSVVSRETLSLMQMQRSETPLRMRKADGSRYVYFRILLIGLLMSTFSKSYKGMALVILHQRHPTDVCRGLIVGTN